jgi:hypothetical protein
MFIDTKKQVERRVWLKTAAAYVSEGQSHSIFNIEVRLGHADMGNGAIGCRSDMWAGTSSHPHTGEQNAIQREKAQQPIPWARTEYVVEFFHLSHNSQRTSNGLG